MGPGSHFYTNPQVIWVHTKGRNATTEKRKHVALLLEKHKNRLSAEKASQEGVMARLLHIIKDT